MIYADQRWIGKLGIGCFARHVLAGLNCLSVSLSSDPAAAQDSLRLSYALRHLTRNDLFFSPGYNSPLLCSAPFVFTIHDLNHIDRPENSGQLKRIYYATVLKRACHLASAVLTVSEFSRSRIIEWSGVSAEKIVNVQCAVEAEYHPGVAPYDFDFPYLLCVSNRKGHKNEFRTVEAFAQAGIDKAVHLVFTGHPARELTACIERNRIADRVKFTGFVPDERMPSLYRSAEALVFPSLYEGFGLPVLEAMACGTPVLTSNTSALPEIAGDAAMLVDPTSVGQIAAGMNRIVCNEPLRLRLRERGFVQASLFSWSITTARVRKILIQ
jgi:glycosyltransferase involved in cell wall biosynthesis